MYSLSNECTADPIEGYSADALNSTHKYFRGQGSRDTETEPDQTKGTARVLLLPLCLSIEQKLERVFSSCQTGTRRNRAESDAGQNSVLGSRATCSNGID
jgi:hypothetical protein